MGIVYGMFLYSGELVGVISLTPGRDVNRYSAEVGYFVGEQYWNRGYATEALRLVGNFAQFRGHLHNHVGLTENFDQSENEEFLVNDSP
jgi:RimJ/RimL family protein N-acetyltransferase